MRRIVYFPANAYHLPEYTIAASNIADLVEVGLENVVPAAAPVAAPLPVAPVMNSTVNTPVISKSFDDPAIMSMGRRPVVAASLSHVPVAVHPSKKSPGPSQPHVPAPTEASLSVVRQQPFHALHVAENGAQPISNTQNETEDGIPAGYTGKRSRRGGNKKNTQKVQGEIHTPAGVKSATPTRDTERSKGWRQTPLLEPVASFQPFSSLKKSTKSKKTYDNGWGTEDATDVQDLGDFDFLGSLAKFDKRTVFNQIEAEDMTADEDRLVSHNRMVKPGTMGGKNLHYTENVLDSKPISNVAAVAAASPRWKSEAGESDEEVEDELDLGSGRNSGRTSRRAESRIGIARRPTSRKGSSINPSQPTVRVVTVSAMVPWNPPLLIIPESNTRNDNSKVCTLFSSD